MPSSSLPAGDGCTLYLQGVWRHCCDAHDLAYVVGEVDKLTADWQLFSCVAATGQWWHAVIMFAGVLLFGGLWWRKARRQR